MQIANKTVVFLGNSKVGKSCLILKLIKGDEKKEYVPNFGCDFHNQEIKVDNTKINLNIWDTYGSEDEITILPLKLYKEANAYVIVASYEDSDSIISVPNWIKHIRNNCPEKEIPIILIMNKTDLARPETREKTLSEYAVQTETFIRIVETSIHSSLNHLTQVLFEVLTVCPKIYRNSLLSTSMNEVLRDDKMRHKQSITSLAERETAIMSFDLKMESSLNCYKSQLQSEKDKQDLLSKTIVKKKGGLCCFS